MVRQCKERFVRLQKERDCHRMQHRRLTQEKNRLIADVKRYWREVYVGEREGGRGERKGREERDLWEDGGLLIPVSLPPLTALRLKEHYSQYEPLMGQLKQKYQVCPARPAGQGG